MMKLRKFLAQVIAVAMIVSSMGLVAFAANNVAAVTANGVTTEYAKVQEAFDAAYASDATEVEIVLLPGTIDENATINQKKDQNVVIKGSAGTVYTGTIQIDGRGGNTNPETLTIDGITFDSSAATASRDIIVNPKKINGGNDYSYPHNVTIQNCNFIGNLDYDIVAAKVITGENIDFYNCTGTDMHSMYQASGNVTTSEVGIVDGCTVVNSKGGFSLGTNCRYNVSNTTIEAFKDYALRWNTNDKGSVVTVTNCDLKAPTAIAVRGKTQDQAKATITDSVLVSTNGGAPIAKDAGKEADAVNIAIFAEGNYWGGSEPVISNIDFEVVTYFADEAKTEMKVVETSDVVAFIDANANGLIDADEATFTSAKDAIESAADGEIVDLLGKTVMVKNLPADPTNARRWFDTDGKAIAITNGTFDLTGTNASDSVFRLEKVDTHLVFDNVDFVKGTEGSVLYFANLQDADTTVVFIECEFDLDGGVKFFVANTSGGRIFVEDCEISNVGGNFFYRGGATVTNCNYVGEDDRFIHACAYPTVLDNTDVVTDAICVIAANGTIAISNDSKVEATDVYNYHASTAPEYTADHITVDATSSLISENIDLDLINDATAGEVISKADSVELVFVEDTTAELDNSVWDIVLVGSDAEIINRLNSADFTFELVAEDDMDYEIAETNSEVEINNVNNDKNRFEFHYKGKKDVTTDTSDRIKLGTVTFTGYGKFNFTVKAADTNAVHATTLNDNIVDTFTAAAGTLVVNNTSENTDGDTDFGTIGSEIIAPTSDLFINVDFPNAVANKTTAYQSMKVTVTGEDIKDIVFDLGSDMVMPTVDQDNKSDEIYKAEFVNGGYVINVANVLTQNTAYDIKVEGAGYRTAHYTVNMQETKSKTINFWNNVKDAEADVEAGKMKQTKNFLAGDIVKDSKINTYDLSAVVSYFGETDLVGNNNAYAKYDLNRDGFIDSKDVAIVLVSWGN